MDGRPLHEFSTRVGIGFQNPATQLSGVTGSVFEEVALGPMNLGLPSARRWIGRRRPWRCSGSKHSPSVSPRLSGGQAQLVVIAVAPGDAAGATSSSTNPPRQLDPEGTRLVGEALRGLAATGNRAAHRRAQDGPARRIVRSDRRPGRRADRRSMARPGDVLADPRLIDWGVEPPSSDPAGGARPRRDGLGPCGPRRGGGDDASGARGGRVRLPGRHARPARRRPDDRAGRGRRDRRPERERQVDARAAPRRPPPPDGRSRPPSTARTWPSRVAALAAASGSCSRTPIARSSRAGSERRSNSGHASSGGRPRTRAPPPREALERVGLADLADANPYDLGSRDASCWRSPRSWRWTRRSSSSTSRRPARTPAVSPGSSRWSTDSSRRAHGHRDQP